MSFWGKLGGAAGGFALGGPLGAIAGALFGHFLVDRASDPAELAAERADERSLAFTIGVIALSAKMAKADGVVAPVEIEAFRRVFSISEKDLDEVGRAFDLATGDTANFRSYAAQLEKLFRDEHATLEDVLHSLAYIAAADGAIHEAEAAYLAEVADIFRLEPSRLHRALSRYVRIEDDPYETLGVEPSATEAELKRRRRELIAENHPDRLTARGLPAEAVRIATTKVATINAAWDRICAERGIA